MFIPTLPPPFGEVLIVGGVSVLGTEFEAPKRLVRSTRDSLERAVGRNEEATEGGPEDDIASDAPTAQNASGKENETETEVNGDDAMAAAVASTLPSSSSDDNRPQKRTMKDKMKSFGRNYVLPFLDQVVGDHKHEPPANDETPDAPTNNDPTPEESTAEDELVEDEKDAAKFHAENHDAVTGSFNEAPTEELNEAKVAETTPVVNKDQSDEAASAEPTAVSPAESD